MNARSSGSRPPSWMLPCAGVLLRLACACLISAALALVAGCGPVRLRATTNIPTPLIVKIPIGVALFVPKEFSQYVHHEERWNTDYEIDLGHAQTEGITRLMTAMFERVIPVDGLNVAGQLDGGVQAILEPSIEEYAFVTPRDAGGAPFFAVSIKYRVNVYLPDGKLADSWGFTGYGTSPSRGFTGETPLAAATALAMRDAGAKLAVEFREQAVLRGLLPPSAPADSQETDPRSRTVQGASAGGMGSPSQVPGSGTVQDSHSQNGPSEDAPSQDDPPEDAPSQDSRPRDSSQDDPALLLKSDAEAGAETPFAESSEETPEEPDETSQPNPSPAPNTASPHAAERPPADEIS